MSFSQFFLKASSIEEFLALSLGFMGQKLSADRVEWLSCESTMLSLVAVSPAPESLPHVRFSKTGGIAGKALMSEEPVLIGENLCGNPSSLAYPGYDESAFASTLFCPVRESEVEGVVLLRRNQNWHATPEEIELAWQLSKEFAHVLALGQHAGSLATQTRMRPVREITASLDRSPYLEEILQLLVNITAEQFQYKVCTVRLLDKDTDELVLRATKATSTEYQRKRAIKSGESIAGKVIASLKTAIVPDVLQDPSYVGHDLAIAEGIRSMICVPIEAQDRAIGVLTCYTDVIREFPEEEVLALETIAKQAGLSILNAKLQVRSTLMQEMHHRVKNNLQQVVSLLRLQLRHRHYESLEDALNDSISRISAIAAVHELLSRDDLDRVGLKSVAQTLVSHLKPTMLTEESDIKVDVRGEDIRLTMTQATQLALVLNELIQNAIEHGFSGRSTGEIHVTFEHEGANLVLWVANNGHPLAPQFDVAKDAHLGLQIVTNLARGLGGTSRLYDSQGWTVAEVRFPIVGNE